MASRRGSNGLRITHRWLGLIAGLGLTLSGLTGSALVFRHEIDAALNPELLEVQPAPSHAPLQAILDGVRRTHPNETPTRIRMPQRVTGTYEIWMGDAPDRYVYADPYRGMLLGDRRPKEFLTGWLFLLHTQLLAGSIGKQLVGIGGFALMLIGLTGLALWWPRGRPGAWRAWRSRLVVQGGNAKRVTHDVHRVTGFYASLFLLIGGLTGASLIYPAAFERAAHVVAGSAPAIVSTTRSVVRAPAAADLSLDTLLAIAERAQPGGVVSYVYLPTSSNPTFRVRKRLPGEKHPNGKSFVHLEPSTGRVVAVENGANAPLGSRLFSILYPLHIGSLGGIATRLLVVLVGLSLPSLAVTGALIWLWRRRPAPGAPAARCDTSTA
jgi:uncharacterized iron-regulated membrane protein